MSAPAADGRSGLGDTWIIACCHLLAHPLALRWNPIGEQKVQGYICDECVLIGPESLSDTVLEPLSIGSMEGLRGIRQ